MIPHSNHIFQNQRLQAFSLSGREQRAFFSGGKGVIDVLFFQQLADCMSTCGFGPVRLFTASMGRMRCMGYTDCMGCMGCVGCNPPGVEGVQALKVRCCA